ncbi:5389_t:CDS:2, partial [Acaulospora colombiana]
EDGIKTKLELLSSYSSCDVADALLKLNYPHGGYLPDIIMFSPEQQAGSSKLVGPVFTVKVVPISDTTSPKPTQHFADASPEGSVVFVSAPSSLYYISLVWYTGYILMELFSLFSDAINAVWGGLMNTRAKVRGVKGVVVDGRIRDLAEIRGDGLP